MCGRRREAAACATADIARTMFEAGYYYSGLCNDIAWTVANRGGIEGICRSGKAEPWLWMSHQPSRADETFN
jgi:hypothetical protein